MRRSYAISYAINVVAPIGLYLLLHSAFGLSNLWALVTGAAVAAAATVYERIRRGQLNSVGLLVLAELAVSVVLIVVTRSPRVLLFKPAVSIGVIGVVLLATCAYGRPAAYQTTLPVIARGGTEQAEAYERAWTTSPGFRLRLRIMTAAWGIAFLIDTAIRVYFAATSSITKAIVVPHVIDVGLIAAAIAISAIQFRHIKRIVTAGAGRGPAGSRS